MELVKRADERVEFPDGSVVILEIESIPKEIRRMILDQSTSKKKNIARQDRHSINEVDWDKYNRLVILRAVKGWSGLKNKHLSIIYDCKEKGDQWEFKGDKGRETEIPFTEDLKRELSEMQSDNFMAYLNAALDKIDEANAKAKEAELKN